MNKSIYYISLDLHNSITPHVLPIKRGDTARELRITLVEDGKPYEITDDCTSKLCGVLPTGTSVELTMTATGNILSVAIPSAWVTTAGEIVCEVRVSSGTELLLISPTFTIVCGAEYSASVTIDQTLPLITSADNGKVMTAINGVWDKATLLPAITSADDGKTVIADDGVWVKGPNLTEIADTLEEEIGYEETEEPTVNFEDGYTIMTAGTQIGTIVESNTNSVTDKIDATGAVRLKMYYTGQNPYGTLVCYASDDSYLDKVTIAAQAVAQEFDLPDGCNYVRFCCMTSRKSNCHLTLTEEVKGNIYTALDAKLAKNQGSANSGKFLTVDEDGDIVPTVTETEKSVYMKSNPSVPLMPEMCADFAWCSMYLPNACTSHNVELTVSGTAGDTELTVSGITEVTMADLDAGIWIGGVLTTDDTAYKVYNFKYKSATAVEIFPALEETVSGATLATLMYDSGETYTGLHLTEHGYRAYAYYLYNSNPKHCEVSKYIAAFRPYLDDEPIPLTKYGGTVYTDINNENRNKQMLTRYMPKSYRMFFPASYTPFEQKTGVYWEVDLKGQSGYLEIYMNAISAALELPEGQEIYVDVYIDGVRTSQTVITDKIGKRIVVDYEKATTGKLDIYCNKWAPIDGEGAGFCISRICWYVNELKYETPLFPKRSIIAQEFDSWGVFHDGASGVALSALHNAASGVTVPYTNNSLGDQTTAWGKSWWYKNVWEKNPSISLTDFVINDTNSVNSSGIPATIEGPDGTVYNNKITKADYADNSRCIIESAIFNGIQPILMRACQHGDTGYIRFTLALIDAISESITEEE